MTEAPVDDLNPYRSPGADAAEGGTLCPYCERRFDLTMRRYLSIRMGRLVCPLCSERGRYQESMMRRLRVLGVAVPLVVVCVWAGSLVGGTPGTVAGYAVFIGVLFAYGRHEQEKNGVLERIPSSTR